MKVAIILLCLGILLYIQYLEKTNKVKFKNDIEYQKVLLKKDRVILGCYEFMGVYAVAIYLAITVRGVLGEMPINITITSNNIFLPFIIFVAVRKVFGYLVILHYHKKSHNEGGGHEKNLYFKRKQKKEG
ncbi:hypothetical protein [Lactococcus ileimucosae]|uniref:hypothetical protein n=1 Tax=Lactococcus ileimucosae TaxID=2941329 RepID=UPI0035129909